MIPENIVIGNPIIEPHEIFAYSLKDWEEIEKEKTVFETERFLPRILAKYSIMKSVSEVKRNRSDLWVTLDKMDFLSVKIGKKKIFILIGE